MAVKEPHFRAEARKLLHGAAIGVSAQRLAIAEYLLFTDQHPSADQVFREVQGRCPMVSRATVYNTVHLLARKGLLRELHLGEGHVVFDPNLHPHHHFVDEASGAIYDVPLDAVPVGPIAPLDGLTVREVQVVLRGNSDETSSPDRAGS